jgi:hypothetical protein
VKSKWLDWTPGSKTIGKTVDAELTEPTNPGSEGFVGGSSGVFPITLKRVRDSSATPSRLPVSDPYAERMRAALRQINPPDYLAGMIPWLDKAHSELYTELISRLPDEIQRLWSGRASLEQFEAALVRLVSSHRRASELYRACLVSRGSERRTKS